MSARSAFRSVGAVLGGEFMGREPELGILLSGVEDLKAGVGRNYCILGPRKIGKTSLLAELGRRLAGDERVLPCRVDLFEANTPARFFVRLVVALADAILLARGEGPLLRGVIDEDARLALAAARLQRLGLRSLDQALDGALAIARGQRGHGRHFAPIIDLPQAIATDLGVFPILMLDEFQETLRFGEFREVRQEVGDVMKWLRAHWQEHDRVLYIVSGSEIALLESVLSASDAPLVGQLLLTRLGPFSAAAARELLGDRFRSSAVTIAPEHVERLIELTNGHPFYLQVLGEDLCLRAEDAKITEGVFKSTLQDCLLSSPGRLHLHFSGVLWRAVGRSSTLERVLVSLADYHVTVSAIAEDTAQLTGAVSTALKQLVERDVVEKREDKSYAIVDPTFALWLVATRSSIRSLAGPYYLGDDAERRVAEIVAREGFRLVYRSLHSKGAFDLLAVVDSRQVGMQVKRAERLPFCATAAEVQRMKEWGTKLGWTPVLAVYHAGEDRALYFDVHTTGHRTDNGVRFEASQASDTLLALT